MPHRKKARPELPNPQENQNREIQKNPDPHRDPKNQKAEEIPLSIKKQPVQKPANQKNIQNGEGAM